MLWMVGSLVKGVHMGIPWVRSGAQWKVWMTAPIKTCCCWQRWKSLMHEIIPMLINSTVCKCLCEQYRRCVCVLVNATARVVDARGDAALAGRGSRLSCCLVTRLKPEPPKQDFFQLFCFHFHPCNKNTQRSYQAQYMKSNSEWQVLDTFSLTQKYRIIR